MTDDPGSLKPLIDILIGGILAILTVTVPLVTVASARPITIPYYVTEVPNL